MTPVVKYDRALLNLLVTIHFLLGLELKVSLCHVLSATSKPGEKSIQVRLVKCLTPDYTENLARQAVMEISFLVAQFFSSESHAKNLYTLCAIQDRICVKISAGNLFKFCCRASTEYQVAVSD